MSPESRRRASGDCGRDGRRLLRAQKHTVLAATFARVADELHRQYLIGFEPTKLDGKMHKLEVRVKKPDAKVRARKEYLAAK